MKYLFSFLPRLGGRRKAFKIGVIATLAIAVGANIAVLGNLGVLFGRVVPGATHRTLLSPYLQSSQRSLPSALQGVPRPIYQRLAKAIEGRVRLAAFQTYRGDASSKQAYENSTNFAKTTPSLARVLGIHPVAGRLLNTDDAKPGAGKAALVSATFARKRFGSAKAAVNQRIKLGAKNYRIVGVLPGDLEFPPNNPAQAWVPLPPEMPKQATTQAAMNSYFNPLHVLMPVSAMPRDQVKAALARAQQQYLTTLPAAAAPALKAMGFEPRIKTYARELYGLTITKLELLEVAALLLVVLVLANLLGLTTADTLARRHEFATRAALGATAWRLYRERLGELLSLGLLGWAIGVGLGWLASRALSATIGHAGVQVALSAPVLLITVAAVVIVMALLALGGIRRLRAPRNLLSDLMTGGRATGGRGLARTLRALIVVQLAASVVLLIVAGHFQANVLALSGNNLGFNPAHLSFAKPSVTGVIVPTDHKKAHESNSKGVSITFNVNGKSNTAAKLHATVHGILSRLRAAPGIDAAAALSKVPLSGENMLSIQARVGGKAVGKNDLKQIGVQAVSPDIFKTLGLKVLAGNPEGIFNASSRSIFIDERTAHEFFPGPTPRQIVGKSLHLAGPAKAKGKDDHRIVAVVADLKVNPYIPGEGQVYKPLNTGFLPLMPTFAVRSRLHGKALQTLVNNVMKQVYPTGAPVKMHSASALIAKAYAKRTRLGRVFGVLAVVALLIAAIGLFALLAYRSLVRRPEFAIRGALGATPGRLLRNVLGEAGALWIVGCVIGVPAAYGLSIVLAAYLPKLGLPAAWVAVAVVIALGLTALIAAFIPARRAAGTDLSGNLSA